MKKMIIAACAVFALTSCSDFLEETPVGELTPEQAQDSNNIEGLIISAYSILDGQMDDASSGLNSGCSNWQFGDVISDDTYKGGGGTGDQNPVHLMEIFHIDPTIQDYNRKWLALYEGVNRCNQAIRILKGSDYDKKETRIAEMRFLRAHFYFNLKIIYNQIPYFDESVSDPSAFASISNKEYTSDQLWEKILNDFKAAYEGLPDSQPDVARPCKMTARAYMAKVYLFQGKWQECATATDEVINSGKYQLLPDFRNIFLPENDNCPEILFSVQASINDGSPNNYNGNPGDRLLPPGGPYPNYGFLAFLISGNISQNLKLLTDSMKQFSNGNFDEQIVPASHDEFAIIADNFNTMGQKIKTLMREVTLEQKQKQQIEYQMLEFQYNALQARLNPHFLYNILDSISSLAKLRDEYDISDWICLLIESRIL